MAQLDNMTEHEIECVVERKMDRLDRKYMQGELSEEEYRRAVKDLDEWATTMLNKETP